MNIGEPPYHPGYGVDPPLLAGREELIAETMSALRAGPRHQSFGLGFVGDRGVGKTALLNEIERRATADLGWPVVVVQAVPGEDLLPGLMERLIDAVGSGWQRTGKLVQQLETELELAANLLVVRASGRARARTGRPASATVALERLLRKVGQSAKQRNSGVLITIDEAHAVRKPQLATLAASLQVVIKRASLPIAVVFAGLPQLRQASHGAGTFFERMPVLDVGYLSRDSSRYALLKPATDLAVSFDDEALELLADESEGYPYLLQLLGFETWVAAKGASRIDGTHARVGVRAALARMDALFQARWDELSDLERDYVHAVAVRGPEPVAVADVQAALKRSSRQLATTRAKLIRQRHILVPVRYGELRLALARFGEWVARQDLRR